MVQKWLRLSCGGLDLVDAQCFQVRRRPSDDNFPPPRVTFLARRAHSVILVSSDAFSGYHFIRRTTTRRATHVLKHPGYWCYPGVESRSFTGRGQADA
ncbi:hypothetical protein K443DRAFT_357661 [Laccaria amethystina LaAM-08-1]|uniref:Uncharacterized protein n=1 Tax=Laccaria amethystina LaAM-08-1 TaxID=1095629 RepID=A0A0C9XEC7_9AGAR|nr:hypothetical protein K443DRAFT_357661 [Laccaria amethystina LaAM-08-1]